VDAKTIEKIEAAGIHSVEEARRNDDGTVDGKFRASAKRWWDKSYQAVNRFYEGGAEAAAANGEAAASG